MKKVMIVFEETDSNDVNKGQGFNVYLAGEKDRIGKIPTDQLSAAEYWAYHCFQIVIGAINRTGAVKSVRPMRPGGECQ